jgi:alpha-D-ribose 1-methylphosphonate 5-triphosphate synthase subunit PhnH
MEDDMQRIGSGKDEYPYNAVTLAIQLDFASEGMESSV